jgi:hypothetical protein
VAVLQAEPAAEPVAEVVDQRRIAIAIMPSDSDIPTLHLISKEQLDAQFTTVEIEPEEEPEPDAEAESVSVRAQESQQVIELPRPVLVGRASRDPMVPIQLITSRGQVVKLWALADTGSQISLLSSKVAEQLQLSASPDPSTLVQFADPSLCRPATKLDEPVTLRCQQRQASSRLFVSQMAEHTHAILGIDLLEVFNIRLQNIPPFHPDITDTSDSTQLDESLSVPATTSTAAPSSDVEREDFIARIMPILEQNNVEVPADALCTHPAAMIRIKHKPGTKPVFRAQYPVAASLRSFLTRKIRHWEATKRIRRFVPTPEMPRPVWHMPLHPIVKSRDEHGNVSDARITSDARGVNQDVEFDPFPLPDMHQLLREMPGPIWTEIDLEAFYCQLTIHEDDRYKLCFTVDGITYEWCAAPFGLSQLTGEAQFLMQAIFADLPFARVFLDNLLVSSSNYAEHFDHLCIIIARLNRWSLRINLSKVKLALDRILALGFQLNKQGISLDPSKMDAVSNWAVPTNKDQVARFIGVIGFLRPNILEFARLTAPLEQAKQSFVWGEAQQYSFDSIKRAVANSVCLVNYDPSKLLHLITDASNVGLSGILYQPDNFGDLPSPTNIIGIVSRATRGSERNHCSYKAELNAGRYAMKKFHQYLLGRHFTWLTDHRSLIYLSGCVDVNRILTAWLHEFAQYQFDVIHVDGARNVLADALSRQYEDSFKVEALTVAARAASVDVSSDPQLMEVVCDAHRWGHFGVNATLQKLRAANIHHPGIRSLVEYAIDNCQACRQWSLGRTVFEEPSSSAPDQPFDEICFDAVPMPPSPDGYHYMLVIVDQFSGFVILKALHDKSAATLAQALWSVISIFGPPLRMTSDGEASNVSSILESMIAAHGIEHRTIAAYTPRQNGKAEAHVKIALDVTRKMLSECGNDWPALLGAATLMINTKHC